MQNLIVPTPAALKSELTTGPLKDTIAQAWAAGDDVTVMNIFNTVNRPSGYIPFRDFVSILIRRKRLGLVLYATKHLLLPDGTACPFEIFDFFCTVDVGIYGGQSIDPPLKFDIAELDPALQFFIAAKRITADDRTAILAAEIQVNRPTELNWVDATIEQIAAARAA